MWEVFWGAATFSISVLGDNLPCYATRFRYIFCIVRHNSKLDVHILQY